jgi:Fur family peroxide stress response transcriptional regulator
MEYLEGNYSHPSAEEIYSALKKRFPTLSLATVYNTLETLRNMGKVVEVGGDSSEKRFDPVVTSHHHLVCINCKKIIDIPEKYKPVLTEEEKKGFQVIRSQVEFYGLCPECRSRRS